MPTPPRAPVAVTVAAAILLAGLVCGTSGLRATPADAAPAVTCTMDWRPAATAAYLTPDGRPTDPAEPLPPAPTPAHRPFHVFCDGRYVNTVWLATPAPVPEVLRAAREVIARAAYPSVRLGVNPTVGITGLASWFWATPDPGPVLMLAGNGPGVELELRAGTVRWTFGDSAGGPVSGLGTPYPAPSPITHVYERKGSYTVSAQVVVTGRFFYDELTDNLPSGSRTVILRHDVAEVRSLLHDG